jgi:hypothetical protein
MPAGNSYQSLKANIAAEEVRLAMLYKELGIDPPKPARMPKIQPIESPQYKALVIPEGMTGKALSQFLNTSKRQNDAKPTTK